MNYKLKRDEYLSSKKYVWKDGRCLGHIFSEVKERQDVDWSKYKEDKTLKMSVSDRLYYNIMQFHIQTKAVVNMIILKTQFSQLKKNNKKCLTIL
jgi:hypothetical protein